MSDWPPTNTPLGENDLFCELNKVNEKPKPFEYYTAEELWTGEHTSQRMLELHLNDDLAMSSRGSHFVDRSVDWIVSRFDVGQGAKVADFGCGPGFYANRLARRGARVTGIDFSSRSIGHAKATAKLEGVEVKYLNQDYLETRLEGEFDLILMIMCDYCALSPAQRRRLLREFHRILGPDGRLLFDVYSLSAFEEREEESRYEANLLDGFWSEQPYYGFLNTFKYGNEKVVLDKYTIVEPTGVKTVFNWLQYFSPDMLEQELANCGLLVESLASDVAGASYCAANPEFAVVAAQKTGDVSWQA